MGLLGGGATLCISAGLGKSDSIPPFTAIVPYVCWLLIAGDGCSVEGGTNKAGSEIKYMVSQGCLWQEGAEDGAQKLLVGRVGCLVLQAAPELAAGLKPAAEPMPRGS